MNDHPPLPSPSREPPEGLRDNFRADATAGFVVFLLALPLSLGIAGASEFPPVMGVLTAIVGGLVATFFTGSQLTIKGPAAGLIVIVADAVSAFGGGIEGWHLALGVMVTAGIVQIGMGLLKWGKFVDLFPLAAVHGMLAAIGLIIIAKQIPVLLNIDPSLASGKAPFALLSAIPSFLGQLDPQVTLIGLGSLAVMVVWPLVSPSGLRRIPAPLIVLAFAIPAALLLQLPRHAPGHTFVVVGRIADQIGWNASTGGLAHPFIFLKFVIMVSLVGTLESLLTVKAIDGLDPWKRTSDPNRDVVAIGVANSVAGLLGGLPMISEVARSSANAAQGARTRWSNFFHGLFLLLAVLLAFPLLELIPNAALAAMLIAVGFKLAHPKKFRQLFEIGPEQLAIFLTTIMVTLLTDLLAGIGAGMLLKMVIHLRRGASLGSLLRSGVDLEEKNDQVTVRLGNTAVFTNYLGLKDKLAKIPPGKALVFDLSRTGMIDHSVMENLHHFELAYTRTGGSVEFRGLDDLIPVSSHPYSARQRPRPRKAP